MPSSFVAPCSLFLQDLAGVGGDALGQPPEERDAVGFEHVAGSAGEALVVGGHPAPGAGGRDDRGRVGRPQEHRARLCGQRAGVDLEEAAGAPLGRQAGVDRSPADLGGVAGGREACDRDALSQEILFLLQ